MACLIKENWKEIGVDIGVKIDLLKHDKIWHMQHSEGINEAEKAVDAESEEEINDGNLDS